MIKNPGEWFINLAGQLTAPLFARGQNIARLKATKAQQQQAMNNFQKGVDCDVFADFGGRVYVGEVTYHSWRWY